MEDSTAVFLSRAALAAGLTLVGAGVLIAPSPILALLGVLLLVAAPFVIAGDVSVAADKAAGFLLFSGVVLLLLSAATVSWVLIVPGLVLVWVARRTANEPGLKERRLNRKMERRAHAFEAEVSRLAITPQALGQCAEPVRVVDQGPALGAPPGRTPSSAIPSSLQEPSSPSSAAAPDASTRSRVTVRLRSASNLIVSVEGAHEQARRLAEHELTRTFGRFAAERPRTPVLVRVPKDMDAAVRETVARARKAKSGFVALGRHGTAAAVTIPIPSEDGLAFAILIHPQEFGSSAGLYKEARRRIYAHEEGHVMDYLSVYPTLGVQGLFQPPRSARALLLRNAFDFVAEYRADRWMVEDEMRRLHGRVHQVTRFVPSLDGVADSLADALDELPEWLVYITRSLQKGLQFDEFLRSVFPRLNEVLLYTAYMCAREDALQKEFTGLTRLRAQPPLRFYFAFLEAVRPKLRAMAEIGPTYESGGLEAVAEVLIPFFHACGLNFRDEAGQIRVIVQTPLFGGDVPLSPDETQRSPIRELSP